MTRECRYVLEAQWPVTPNRRYHPEAVLTLFVRPTRPMLRAADYCDADRSLGAYLAYINQWAFYHAIQPLPRCAFSDYGALPFATANAIWTDPANLRMPRQLVVPVPWNLQTIRPPTAAELERFFPQGGQSEANRYHFLQTPDGNRGAAYESSLGSAIPRFFSEFVQPRAASEVWHPQNDIRVYFNKRPVCSSNYNEWHQTNHRSSPNIAIDQDYPFGFNRLTDEARSIPTHNTQTYPFDEDADVRASFTSLELDCLIFIRKSPSDAQGAVRFARIAQCIGQAPFCTDPDNCQFNIKLTADYASARGAQCLFPTPVQMVGPACRALIDALRDTDPSRTCACGNGQFIGVPDAYSQYFVGTSFGYTSLVVSRSAPDPAAEFLLAYPLWTWAGEKYLSFEFTRERYCNLHGAEHDVTSWPPALIQAGILALPNSYGFGFRRDVGRQHVGTATIEFRQIFSPELVLLAPGLRNDDRPTVADLQYSATPVVNGELSRDGSNRRMTLRGFDQGAAAPRPLNSRILDFQRISKLMPRCRLTYPYDIVRYPPNSTAYVNWLRATGNTVQPRAQAGQFELNYVTTTTYVDAVPSNDFYIHTYATVYRDDIFVVENNAGNVELRNGDLYQAYVPHRSAAIGVRTFNDFDPIEIAFETALAASFLPPCDCRSDTNAASIPGGVACNLPANGDQQYLNEVNLRNPEVGTYQDSPINCSILIPDSAPGALPGDVLVMQSRFYEARALFEPSTTQTHGVIWYAWQLSGANAGLAVLGNATARTAAYNLRSIPVKFNAPGFYTLTVGISTGRTRLFLQCAQRVQVLAGCPASFVTQSTSVAVRNQSVTLAATMPDNGIGGAAFVFDWNVYTTTPSGLASAAHISKAGNAVVAFKASQIGEYLVSLDITGYASQALTPPPFCRSYALYKISVVNDTAAFNRFVNPDALVIPTACLGSVGNFSTNELPGTTRSVDESSLLSARFSLNKNVFNVFFSDQFESKALEVSTVVAAALGLPTSRTDSARGKQVKTGASLGDTAGTVAATADTTEEATPEAALRRSFTTVVTIAASVLFAIMLLYAAYTTAFFQRVYGYFYDMLLRRSLYEALRDFDRHCAIVEAGARAAPRGSVASASSKEITRTYVIRGSDFVPRIRALFCLPLDGSAPRRGSVQLRCENRQLIIQQIELMPYGPYNPAPRLDLRYQRKGKARVYELSNAVELYKMYHAQEAARAAALDSVVIEVPDSAAQLQDHLRTYRTTFGKPLWLEASANHKTGTRVFKAKLER